LLNRIITQMNKTLLFAFLMPLFVNAQSIKNLDIKNGFLQFHLGDSLSVYKNDIYIAYKNHPNENEVKPKVFALHKYIDKVTLVSENGILTEIDVYMEKEAHEAYMDQLMIDTYGRGIETPNLDKNEPGTHVTFTTWKGERVTALIVQTNINRYVNNKLTRGRIQSIVFEKTGDAKIDGDLPPDFPM